MKSFGKFLRSNWYYLLNAFLVFLMVFFLLPAAVPAVNAKSDKNTQDNITSNNSTISDDGFNISSNNTDTLLTTDNLNVDTVKLKPNRISIDPDDSGNITSPSGKIKLRFPIGSVKESVGIEFSETVIHSSSGMKMLKFFELNAYNLDNSQNNKSKKNLPKSDNSSLNQGDNITLPQDDDLTLPQNDDLTTVDFLDKKSNFHFEKDLTLSIQNTKEELAGLDIDSLHLYYLDETTNQWLMVPGEFDKETLTLTAHITHFSTYGEQANPLKNGPGRVMASEVELHSGSASYSYPIELPPGPGGFTPSVTLAYNSGSVDGMKNKRDVGSWVGIGWSLHLGKISYDSDKQEYNLDLNGGSYKIVSIGDNNYKTQPDQYFKISRTGTLYNTWQVRDKNGIKYTFGSSENATQYVYNLSRQYYRWDLSKIEDANGNIANISYIQEKTGVSPDDTVRAAYITSIIYGNNRVNFASSWDESDTLGHVRYDNPILIGSQPAPKIMETRRLDDIEVFSDGNLVRKYSFSYTTTDRIHSGDYDGIYYSGSMKLDKITQYGSDGISFLPAIEFSYEDKQVYRVANSNEQPYSGNPGNPATLIWPYLVEINSGYGGTVNFIYTRNPSTLVIDTWSRQTVTSKIIDSGIGPAEIHQYHYSSNPAYKGTGWDQEFRGWNEVIETDANNNSIKHYYYTNTAVNNKSADDAEKLTGKEYETKYYGGANLLNTKKNEWSINNISPIYRKQITIMGSSAGAQTNYQLTLTVNRGTGPDSLNSVFLNSHCRADFSDIWFTKADGITPLNYWIESKTDNVSATVWVKFDSIPISPNTANFYIYYGNSAATSVSSGTNTFIIFDDFERDVNGSAIGGSWLDARAGAKISTDRSISGTRCLILPGCDNGLSFSHYIPLSNTNVALGFKAWKENAGGFTFVVGNGSELLWVCPHPDETIYYPNDARNCLIPANGSCVADTWQSWELYNINFSAGTGIVKVQDGSLVAINNTVPLTNYPPCVCLAGDNALGSAYGIGNDAYIDDFFVRNYIANGPTFSSWGGEEDTDVFSIQLDRVDEINYSSSTDEPGGNWLSNWNFRKQMNVAGSAGTQTNYQLKLNVFKNSGTDSGSNVYLNGHCTPEFSDIWFTKSDGVSRLDYWIESVIGNTAIVWVEFDSIPAAPGNATFYIYYGNASAESASDGGSTFPFFDDFLGTSLDAERWSTKAGTVNVINGEAKLQAGVRMYTNSFFPYNQALRAKVKTAYFANASYSLQCNFSNLDTDFPVYPGNFGYFSHPIPSTNGMWSNYNGTHYPSNIIGWTANVYHVLDIEREGTTSANYLVDNANQVTITSGVTTDNHRLNLASSLNDGVVADWVLVRNYVANGPTISSWESEEVKGAKTTSTGFEYDLYGNVDVQSLYGDISDSTDDSVINREYCYNDSDDTYIVSKVSHEWVTDSQTATVKEAFYYYDEHNSSYIAAPAKGNLTKLEQKTTSTYSVNTTSEFDSQGNILNTTDPEENTTSFTYDTNGIYTTSKTLPVSGFVENYTYSQNWNEGSDTGTMKVTVTDVNGNITTSYYDKFNRLWKVVKPNDTYASPSIEYIYNDWGMIDQQNIETRTKISDGIYLWQKEYFDGLGRVIQTQNKGEPGHTIVTSTTTFNSRGLVDKQYVSQDIGEVLASYQAPDTNPDTGWKYATSAYDVLGRVIDQINPDGTTVSHDYSIAWQDTVSTPGLTPGTPHKKRYSYDAFQRLTKVEELYDNGNPYATTTYAYDTLGNLKQVTDNENNPTQMWYDWLSRKTAMSDPDMGTWGYRYDDNGNLRIQTDAKGQPIEMTYDALNRLTAKIYPAASGMTNVSYNYDEGANGKGRRTGMIDGSGSTAYSYNNLGLLISESRMIDGAGPYITQYIYDGADRLSTVVYPNGEVVTQQYNGRGLPNNLICGSTSLVGNTQYNQLGAVTEINLGNGIKTAYSYYGLDPDAPTGGYYGRLWEIESSAPELSGNHLTVNSGGHIELPGEGTFDDYGDGESVNIKAIPDPGYRFVRWTGDDISSIDDIFAASTNITMNGSYSISAIFTPIGPAGGVLQRTRYTWDPAGNMASRFDVLTQETEDFTYDHLDRLLTASSSSYSEIYEYTTIGNIMSRTRNGNTQTYGYPSNHVRPHAVTSVGDTNYTYDANGNMETVTSTSANKIYDWDVENRLTSVSVDGNTTAQFFYDGDGNRVKKIEGGITSIYVNQYYEINSDGVTTNATSYYYLGGRLIAQSENGTLNYVHQDSLSSTSLMTDALGAQVGSTVKYLPFGEARNTVTVPTDKLFTGQRLDSTGLYYYNARYYDPTIGRFISPDTIIPYPADPQSLNRYSYCRNNPLKYTDPSGNLDSDYMVLMQYLQKQEVAKGIQNSLGNANAFGYGAAAFINLMNVNPNEPIPNVVLDILDRGTGGGISKAFEPKHDLVALISQAVLGIVVIASTKGEVSGEGIAIVAAGIENITNSLFNTKQQYSYAKSGIPQAKDGFKPRKNWNGLKVRSPNGPEWGYPDKNGDVWVPQQHAPGTHAPHWDVQHPGGGYTPVYPVQIVQM